jgi:DNA-binding XRE family transcriptional regulator
MDSIDYAGDGFAPTNRTLHGHVAADTWGQAMGARLRTLRIERDLTQQAVADLANLSVSALSRIERGERPPTIRTLRKLASGLHVDLRDLLEIHEL